MSSEQNVLQMRGKGGTIDAKSKTRGAGHGANRNRTGIEQCAVGMTGTDGKSEAKSKTRCAGGSVYGRINGIRNCGSGISFNGRQINNKQNFVQHM